MTGITHEGLTAWLYRATVLAGAAAICILPGRPLLLASVVGWLAFEVACLAMDTRRAGILGCWQGLQWWALMSSACSLATVAVLSGLASYLCAVSLARIEESVRYNCFAIIAATAAAAISGSLGCVNDLLLEGHAGVAVLLATVSTVGVQDFAAALIGRALPVGSLARLISPKKTISGALGGACCAIAAGWAVARIEDARLPWFAVPGFAVAALLGDLLFSSIKRSCGRKDFGQILGSKGGLLDRADSALLALILAYQACPSRG